MVFKPEERMIFEYWDGSSTRKADPLELIRAVHTVEGFDPLADSKAADLGDVRAMGRVIDAVRKVFNVESYSEDENGPKGLLSYEVLQLMQALKKFMDEIQKKTENLLTLPDTTDSSQEKSATSNTAASG